MIRSGTQQDRCSVRQLVPPTSALHDEASTGQDNADVAAVGRIGSVPAMLRLICDLTCMRHAAVVRVADDDWVACAVNDQGASGSMPGGQRGIEATPIDELVECRTPVAIDHVGADARYRDRRGRHSLGIQSYVSVPIVLSTGEYFGNLCAFDPRPANVSGPKVIAQLRLFAELIALHLVNDRRRHRERAAAIEERDTGKLSAESVAVLAHDLRNPLAGVLAGSALMERLSTDENLRSTAQRISRSARRMSALIDRTLDSARVRRGDAIGIERVEVSDFGDAMRAVVGELRDANPNRAVQFGTDIDGQVYCDRVRVQQLFSNLVANALTHGSSVGVTVASAVVDGDDVVLSVSNEGDPIPVDCLAKIFSPFWRGATAPDRDGLGLGLYISAQIARAHGGRLDVSSSAENGTRVVARIPMRRRRAGGAAGSLAVVNSGDQPSMSARRCASAALASPGTL